MLSPRSVQPRCALRAEEHCEAAGRRYVPIQQDRMQFRQLNAYAAECNSVSLWIMNIHLSGSFFFSPIPLRFGSWCLGRVNLAQSSSAEHVLFSNYLPTALCPTPHDQFTNSMFRQHTAFPKQAHDAFLMFSALLSSLLQHWLWHTIITATINTASGKVGALLSVSILQHACGKVCHFLIYSR